MDCDKGPKEVIISLPTKFQNTSSRRRSMPQLQAMRWRFELLVDRCSEPVALERRTPEYESQLGTIRAHETQKPRPANRPRVSSVKTVVEHLQG